MAKYKNNAGPSTQTIEEAEAMAKATAKPGQTKEQTKLIAQGIQKGIEEYKKRQKSKARELDKRLKKVKQTPQHSEPPAIEIKQPPANSNKLPWVLLALSWTTFIAYTIINR